MKSVLIRGSGIAAICCEYLLRKAGIAVSVEAAERPRLPAILLSGAALALIRDIFENDELFRDARPIGRRIVAWGDGAQAVEMPHSAVLVSEEILLEGVSRALHATAINPISPDWTVYTSSPLPPETVAHGWGSRRARATPVTLRDDSNACWMESISDGWLFLVPGGWLLAVGDARLEHSKLIAREISEIRGAAREFPAYPRIASPLCGPGWIACGTAAMAFDPICGDGTANAIREAILATAIIRAVFEGGDRDTLLAHYEARLTAGFEKHLAFSASFYQTGNTGQWWSTELASLKNGLEWCGKRRAASYRYRLNGFNLEPLR